MATTTATMPTADSMLESALNFIRAHLVRNGIGAASARAAVAKGSDRWMTAQMAVQLTSVVLANNRALEDATMPDTATGDDLDRLCAIYGLARSSGAGAQGNVTVTTSGSVTFAAGQELTADSTGKRYKVVTTTTVGSGGSVPIIGIDTGKSTNLAESAKMTWVSPPAGCSSGCVVGTGGLTNGQDGETDGRLRQRLLRRLQQPQNGGSWSHYQQWAEDASSAVQGVWVYPAFRGPGTVGVAIAIEGTADNAYDREAPEALRQLVDAAVTGEQPEFADVTVKSVVEQDLSVAFKLTLPEPPSGGGKGGGWVDPSADRWAKAKIGAGNTNGIVKVTTVTSTTALTVNAYNEPVDGSTICVYHQSSRTLSRAVVLSHSGSGSAGAWPIVLDRALSDVSVNDYVFPACENAESYAETYAASIAALSPGEWTDEAEALPRAYRHPATEDGYPSAVTTMQLAAMQTAHPEVVNASYFAIDDVVSSFTLPYEPDVATSVQTDAPNIFRVDRIAFYPES